METQIALSWYEWRKMVRSDRKKEKEEKGGQRGRVGLGWGYRQRLGPTYNREHERAQNVPQRGPGDGRNRWHHALEPRQPTLTITTAIHTHTEETHTQTCKLIHIQIWLTQWYSKVKLQPQSGWLWWNWNSSFFYWAAVSLEYHCVMILIPNTLVVHCIWITVVLMCC